MYGQDKTKQPLKDELRNPQEIGDQDRLYVYLRRMAHNLLRCYMNEDLEGIERVYTDLEASNVEGSVPQTRQELQLCAFHLLCSHFKTYQTQELDIFSQLLELEGVELQPDNAFYSLGQLDREQEQQVLQILNHPDFLLSFQSLGTEAKEEFFKSQGRDIYTNLFTPSIADWFETRWSEHQRAQGSFVQTYLQSQQYEILRRTYTSYDDRAEAVIRHYQLTGDEKEVAELFNRTRATLYRGENLDKLAPLLAVQKEKKLLEHSVSLQSQPLSSELSKAQKFKI